MTDPVDNHSHGDGVGSFLRESITPGLAIVADLIAVITLLVAGTGIQGARLAAITLGVVSVVAATSYILAGQTRTSRRKRWASSVAIVGVIALLVGIFVPVSTRSSGSTASSTPSSQFSPASSVTPVPSLSPGSAFEMELNVRTAEGWVREVTTTPSNGYQFMATYRNSGTTHHRDVVMIVELPEGLAYIPGSTRLVNSSNPNGLSTSDNIASKVGINIGDYQSGAIAYVLFTAYLAGGDKFPCREKTIVPQLKIIIDGGYKSAEAVVKVRKRGCGGT